ncbi:MAG TPA: CaiB/BaiF CoA-transferase family protein [Micropepsaceae bacterium]|nr:CaiB/BaiF CoA-transferase family protein [Micropepsaceae bacterium]
MIAGAAPRRALDGVRVLALETSLSGPHATKILADMGAEVIKIERPGTGDVIRGWDNAVKGLSSGIVWIGPNKKSFAIDVKKPAAREILQRLGGKVDVVLENFAPGAAKRMGLGAKELRELNPRLIYCSLSGYGQDGPFRDKKAYDALIQGEAGMIMTTGFEDRPARVGVSVTDLISSMYAAVGILTALYQRSQTGEGQIIDISMFETAASWLGYFPHHYWHRGEEPKRYGLRHQYITPYGHYLAGDGKYFGVAVASPADWAIFCTGVIERPDLLTDPRFKDTPARRANREELDAILNGIFLTQPSTEWLKRLDKVRLPHGTVNGVGEVLAHPQMQARHMIQEIDSPVGRIPVLATPLHLSDSPQRLDPMPALGEDTDSILRDLGYSDADIAALRKDQVI